MNTGKNVVKRKGLVWYSRQSIEERRKIFKDITFKICSFLKQDYSASLSKAMTRNELGYGFDLVDFVGRNSKEIQKLKTLLAHN